MKIYFTATCPYCGYENKYYYEPESQRTRLMVYTCDNEEGGCDLPFVVSVELKPEVSTLKIVGMQDVYQDNQKEESHEWAGVDSGLDED